MINIKLPAETPIVLPFTRPRAVDPENPPERRLRGFSWLGNSFRNHFVAMLGEFAGTFLFLFFAFIGTQVANAGADPDVKKPQPMVLLYISLVFAFSLGCNVWVFFRISGGLFNPAVTLALCLVGAVDWVRGVLVGISQILGAIAAAALVSGLLPGPLVVRTRLNEDAGISVVRGLWIEAFCTCQLIFTIFMLAAEKHKGTFLAPIAIALALFIAELAAVYWTGGSLNPARSFGPDVVLGKFDSYHWIYWVGPLLGALFAALFYRLVKVLEYETANPGQDFDNTQSRMQPMEEHSRGVTDGAYDGTGDGRYERSSRLNAMDHIAAGTRISNKPEQFNLSSSGPSREQPNDIRALGTVGDQIASNRNYYQNPDVERERIAHGRA